MIRVANEVKLTPSPTSEDTFILCSRLIATFMSIQVVDHLLNRLNFLVPRRFTQGSWESLKNAKAQRKAERKKRSFPIFHLASHDPLRCDYRRNYQEAGGSLHECELFLFDPPLKNYFNKYFTRKTMSFLALQTLIAFSPLTRINTSRKATLTLSAVSCTRSCRLPSKGFRSG